MIKSFFSFFPLFFAGGGAIKGRTIKHQPPTLIGLTQLMVETNTEDMTQVLSNLISTAISKLLEQGKTNLLQIFILIQLLMYV